MYLYQYHSVQSPPTIAAIFILRRHVLGEVLGPWILGPRVPYLYLPKFTTVNS